MNEYTPDRWVMLKIHSETHGTIFRIFSGCYGGFTGGDSWKLSSGNTDIIDHDDYYEIPQMSGNVYMCSRSAIGMSSYMHGIFNHWRDKVMTDGSTIEIVDIEEARKALV